MEDNIYTVDKAIQLSDMLGLKLSYTDTHFDSCGIYDEYSIAHTSATMHISQDDDRFKVLYESYVIAVDNDKLVCLDAYVNDDYSVSLHDDEASFYTLDNIKHAIRSI